MLGATFLQAAPCCHKHAWMGITEDASAQEKIATADLRCTFYDTQGMLWNLSA